MQICSFTPLMGPWGFAIAVSSLSPTQTVEVKLNAKCKEPLKEPPGVGMLMWLWCGDRCMQFSWSLPSYICSNHCLSCASNPFAGSFSFSSTPSSLLFQLGLILWLWWIQIDLDQINSPKGKPLLCCGISPTSSSSCSSVYSQLSSDGLLVQCRQLSLGACRANQTGIHFRALTEIRNLSCLISTEIIPLVNQRGLKMTYSVLESGPKPAGSSWSCSAQSKVSSQCWCAYCVCLH